MSDLSIIDGNGKIRNTPQSVLPMRYPEIIEYEKINLPMMYVRQI